MNSNRHSPRSGLASVEFAITLPLIVVLVFGSIDAANLVFLKQTATLGAFEAAKFASRPGGTASDAETRCAEFLGSRAVSDYQLTIVPRDVQAVVPGGQIDVTLIIPASSVTLGQVTVRKTVAVARQ